MCKQEPKHKEPSQAEVAAMIADELGETEEWPRHNISIIVRALGRKQSRRLLKQAQQIEADGGMMLPDNSRRRTPGGIFFYLAYTTGKPKHGKQLIRPIYRQMSKLKEQKQSPQSLPKEKYPVTTFSWDNRIAAIQEADIKKGTISTVKITIVGRPGKILDKGSCIVTMMESTKVPALPKGLPIPTAAATKYAIYITAKQWTRVKDAIADPEDTLIVEGFPKTDPQVSAIAVFATNVTTKKLQTDKR